MSSSRLTTILFILLLSFILAIFYLSVHSSTPSSKTPNPPAEPAKETVSLTAPTITLADPSLGPTKASIMIVDFSDFSCPHCAAADMELKKILQTYPDKARLVWKDFPFLPPLNLTWLAHEAARCAEKQNQFWEYHDLLFANQGNLTEEKLSQFAQELKLNETQFNQCLSTGQTRPLVQRGFEEGRALGVDGAPYFFVNGEKWKGEMTVERIGELIK